MNFKNMFFILLFISNNLFSYEYNDCPNYYLRGEVGGSFSKKANICTDPRVWDPAIQGYNNTLKTVPVVGFGFGRIFNDWFSAGVSVNHRSKFKYCKFQTPSSSGTPGFLGTKTRFFNLDNTSFMADIFFNRSGKNNWLSYECCSLGIAPYLGVGVGLSKNSMYNFHTVQQTTVTAAGVTEHPVASIMTPNVINTLAWQIQLGVDISICANGSIGIGYRYFDGGKFRSNDYISSIVSSYGSPVTAPAWKGKLRANEFVVSFNLEF